MPRDSSLGDPRFLLKKRVLKCFMMLLVIIILSFDLFDFEDLIGEETVLEGAVSLSIDWASLLIPAVSHLT